MKITPQPGILQLEIEEATAGALDTSSRDSAVEFAKVVAVDKVTVTGINVGDHVFVKAWAIDIINHEGKKYYFCNLETKGILAVVK